MRVTLAGLTFTTAVRMVDRVHDHAAHRRADALMALGTGGSPGTQVVLEIAETADGGAAVGINAADFTGAQTQSGVLAFAGDQLHAAPAERAICAPLPTRISMQWMVEPIGILRKGSTLPGLIGASCPD